MFGNEIFRRVSSAVFMASLAVLAAYSGGIFFIAFWFVVCAGMFWEWINALSKTNKKGRGWYLSGLLFISLVFLATLGVRGDSESGFFSLLLVFFVVWTTDTGAFFSGRFFGGPRLFPRVSPQKTFSGAIGGLLSGVFAGSAWIAFAAPGTSLLNGALISFALSFASILGDFFESLLKRTLGVKDLGWIIPGHGGLFDRLDGYAFAIFVAWTIGFFRLGFDSVAEGLLYWR